MKYGNLLRSFTVFSLGLLVFPSAVRSQATPLVDHFSENGTANAVGLLQSPAGEYHKGITYVTYQGTKADPYIASYNHETAQWMGPFKAGVSELGKEKDGKIDSHGKPAMIIDDEGYIHIIYGGHGADDSYGHNPLGNTHKGRMFHSVSKRPLDITDWVDLDNISPFGTYGHFVKMDNGDIYYFYRHGAHRSHWVYQLSTDNARTFQDPVSVVKNVPHVDEQGRGYHDSWYCHFSKGPDGKILATYTYHTCWNWDVPHTQEQRDNFVMIFDTQTGKWQNLHGEELTLPITKEIADQKTLAVETPEDLWISLGVGRLDPTGKPHLLYTAGGIRDIRFKAPAKAYYYRWDGQAWVGPDTALFPTDSRGDIRPASPLETAILVGGQNEVGWWRSSDGGLSFQREAPLLQRENSRFLTTSLIRNAHPDAQVLVAEIDHSKKGPSRRMYLIGDQGPVRRPKSELSD